MGIALSGVHPGLWREITTRAEELGYESVWLPEHLVLPAVMTGSPHDGHAHPPIPPQTPIYDAIVYLSYLAGLTSTIRLGTYVYNIGLRHPFVSARAAATIDIISNGRFDFGVGARWLRQEWEAVGLDFVTAWRTSRRQCAHSAHCGSTTDAKAVHRSPRVRRQHRQTTSAGLPRRVSTD